jgi:hypothetical protein
VAGAVQVNVTSLGVKASSYLAESGGMVGAMRALTQASMDFSNDIRVRRPNIAQFYDSQSLVKSIEGRIHDCKLARNSATRVWWPKISYAEVVAEGGSKMGHQMATGPY